MAHILVIEDDEQVRALIGRVLKMAGHEVRAAADGHAGMAGLVAGPCDVLITDILMPGRDGLEIIRKVRAAHSTVKILAISGGGDVLRKDELLVDAAAFGADACLGKPFSCEDLVRAVTALCPASSSCA